MKAAKRSKSASSVLSLEPKEAEVFDPAIASLAVTTVLRVLQWSLGGAI